MPVSYQRSSACIAIFITAPACTQAYNPLVFDLSHKDAVQILMQRGFLRANYHYPILNIRIEEVSTVGQPERIVR